MSFIGEVLRKKSVVEKTFRYLPNLLKFSTIKLLHYTVVHQLTRVSLSYLMVGITLNGIVITDIYSFQIQVEVDIVPHTMLVLYMMVKTLLV